MLEFKRRILLSGGPVAESDLRRLDPITDLLVESSLDGKALRELSVGSPNACVRPDAKGVFWLDGVGLEFNRSAGTVRVMQAYGLENECEVELDAVAGVIDRYEEARDRWERRHPAEILQTEFAYRILLLEDLRVVSSTVPIFTRSIDALGYWISRSTMGVILEAIDERRSVCFRVYEFEVVVDPERNAVVVVDRLNFSKGPDVFLLEEARRALTGE